MRAVVEAYGEGRIELDEPAAVKHGGRVWYAPSFVQGSEEEEALPRPYTKNTVAQFLGWTYTNGKANAKTNDALRALEYIARCGRPCAAPPLSAAS